MILIQSRHTAFTILFMCILLVQEFVTVFISLNTGTHSVNMCTSKYVYFYSVNMGTFKNDASV